MSSLRGTLCLRAQTTHTHTHNICWVTHLHIHSHTQTSNCALLRQQIIRNMLHCGRSESFLIKFRGKAPDMENTHIYTLCLFLCLFFYHHNFITSTVLVYWTYFTGLKVSVFLYDPTVDSLTATFTFILSVVFDNYHSITPPPNRDCPITAQQTFRCEFLHMLRRYIYTFFRLAKTKNTRAKVSGRGLDYRLQMCRPKGKLQLLTYTANELSTYSNF